MVQQIQKWCEACGNGDHSANACAANPKSVNYIGNAQRQGNQNFKITYSANWQNHPNFLWGGNQGQNTNQYQG